jgi:hypothetical protein
MFGNFFVTFVKRRSINAGIHLHPHLAEKESVPFLERQATKQHM